MTTMTTTTTTTTTSTGTRAASPNERQQCKTKEKKSVGEREQENIEIKKTNKKLETLAGREGGAVQTGPRQTVGAVQAEMAGNSIRISLVIAPKSLGKQHVLRHHRDSLGMDSTNVCVLKHANEICFGGFLEGSHGSGLETQLGAVLQNVVAQLAHQPTKRRLSQQQVCCCLQLANFPKSNSAWAEASLLSLASRGRGPLAGDARCLLSS